MSALERFILKIGKDLVQDVADDVKIARVTAVVERNPDKKISTAGETTKAFDRKVEKLRNRMKALVDEGYTEKQAKAMILGHMSMKKKVMSDAVKHVRSMKIGTALGGGVIAGGATAGVIANKMKE